LASCCCLSKINADCLRLPPLVYDRYSACSSAVMFMNRRQCLKLLSMGSPGMCAFALLRSKAWASLGQGPSSPQIGPFSRADPPKYLDPLPILPRLQPSSEKGGMRQYRVRIMQFRQWLHSRLPPATVWGYEGRYPGPIIEGVVNQPVTIEWVNQLPERHLFAIDPKIHGATPPNPAVRTVTHLHGAHAASKSDGLPESWIRPGQSAVFHYPNRQPAATLWYHDHALGITRLNNYAGLSGIYLLRDEQEKQLNLPSGPYEIPLMIQDRLIDAQGQMVYLPSNTKAPRLAPGIWGPEIFGNVALVNGAIHPYLLVEPRRYRFRIVNAANSRFFSIFFSDPAIPFSNVARPFVQIGSDGGLLHEPVPVPSVVLAPGERADIVVDFSKDAGKKLILSNHAPAPFSRSEGEDSTEKPAPLRDLMEIRVASQAGAPDTSAEPSWSLPMERLQREAAVKTRDLVLYEYQDASGNSLGLKINGAGYGDPVSETPKVNTTEIWRFINTDMDTHPMHVHLAQFQILERQVFDPQKFLNTHKLDLVGPARPPDKNESGWKDTVKVNPGEVVSIIIPFREFTGKYVYHCHMLEHEDNEMMRPFQVTA
jgi:spore coat protein A